MIAQLKFCTCLLFCCFLLSGCDVTSRGGGTFTAPSGASASMAKCTGSPTACYRSASAACSGPYQVIDSERHWGGVISESGTGTMWYVMAYQCGPSDGKLPPFPMRDGTSNINVTVQ